MDRFYRMSGKWLTLLLSWIGLVAMAQEEVKLVPVTRTYAITNVNIIQSPGRKVDMGMVIIKNGVIRGVGKNLSIPPDAIVIKADSMYVYAGFIDGYSHTGVTKPKEEQNRERPKDPGNPEPAQAGITPQNDVRASLNPADKTVEDLRALGFTTAHVVPYGGMLPGTGSIIQLNGDKADDLVLVPAASFYSELTPAQRVYPNTVIGVMAKYRELYRQASLAKNYESMYASNRSGLERPTSDKILETFYPVIDKRLPVLFKAERFLDAQRILTLQNDLGFQVMLGDVKEGWDMISKIKASNAKVFLTLDLPEAVKEEKKDEKSSKEVNAENEALEKRKAEAIALYTAQASAFQKAGIPFGFSANSAKVKDIQTNLRRMIAAGLTEDQALAALTTTPAQLLGLSDRLGSVDNGKIANLVISDKPYFNEKAKVRYVFVDGVMYKYDVKEEKKSEGANGKKADPSGTWSYSTETPQGNSTGVIKIKNDGGTYTGTITSSMSGQESPLKSVTLDGNTLTFSFGFNAGGSELPIDVSVKLDGNEFEGTMTAGQYGSFPMKGTKEPNQ
jgi:imidazolonepropionase-like amidohydrolase